MKEPDHFGETVSQFRRKYLTTIHSKAGLMDRPCPNIFTQLPRCTGPDRENYDTRDNAKRFDETKKSVLKLLLPVLGETWPILDYVTRAPERHRGGKLFREY
jgi:hypothetical protein